MVTDTHALTDAVVALAREAGEDILAVYHGPAAAAAEAKSDRSPLTEADRAAHRRIVAGLARLDPGTPVISEEGEIPSYEVRRDWSRFWLVDPLDGTKEFLKRNGEFTVNIALVEDGEPVLGVILAPALDTCWWAARDAGAWKQEGDAPPVRIHARRRPPGAPLTIVESRSHPSPELEAFLADLPVGERVAAGSSLKFCWVAEGRADCYPRLGPTMEWDVAAGDCIWRNAGPDGPLPSPLTYNKPDLRNPSFVIGR